MRCLVTGASGFLGSHLVSELIARRHEVTILLRPETQAWRLRGCLSNVRVVYGSMEDTANLAGALRAEPVEVAFHLAWAGVTGEQRNSTDQVMSNVVHGLALWRLLHISGCSTFVSVGSQAEYGPHPERLHEALLTNPVTVYGASKLALCILLKQLCVSTGIRFVWMRLLSAYGPADDERHMVPGLIRSLLKGERPLLTAGEQVWDYLYVTDAVDALCASVESEASGVFNLGSGVECILRQFISSIRDCIDPALPLGFGEVPYRRDQVMHLSTDISRIQQATGWRPRISMEEGIRRTVAWYQEHGVGYGS